MLTSSSSKSGLVKNFGKKYSSSACSDESIFSSSSSSSSPSSSSFTVRPLPPSDLAGPAETALLAFVAADSVDEPVRSFALFVAARNASRVARTPSRNEESGVVEVEVEVEAAGGWKSKGGLMK